MVQAIILAGGRGTRLAPYTTVFPKPLVPIGEVPILEIILRQLKAQGIQETTLAVGYLSELIKAYISQRPALTDGHRISYHDELEPTGTAGSLASIDRPAETFLVMNGDVLTNLRLADMLAHHRAHDAVLTIATARRDVKIDLGVLDIGDDNRITGYREKPSLHYDVSMGMYLMEPRVLDLVAPNEYLDFPDLVLRLLATGERVSSYMSGALWLDIGRHDDYERAVELFEEHRDSFLDALERSSAPARVLIHV
ncbi:MAG TPA: sugar phosphate nucleotidyltransferase [Rubricoccaceae bacterium]|jgi:NDP-sugar pyrophosphorylase family protein